MSNTNYIYDTSECYYFYCGQCDVCNRQDNRGRRERSFAYITKSYNNKCYFKCDQCEPYVEKTLIGVNTELNNSDKPCFFMSGDEPDYLNRFALSCFGRDYLYMIYIAPNVEYDTDRELVCEDFNVEYQPTEDNMKDISEVDPVYQKVLELKNGTCIIVRGISESYDYDILHVFNNYVEVKN